MSRPGALLTERVVALGLRKRWLLVGDLKDVDLSISGAGKEGVAISRPGQRHDPRSAALGRLRGDDLLKDGLVLKIVHADTVISSNAQPVVLRGEGQGLDGGTSLEGVQVLALIDIKEHSRAVFTTRGAQGTIRRDGHGVDDTSVTREVSAKLHVGQVPNLDELVPTGRDDHGSL